MVVYDVKNDGQPVKVRLVHKAAEVVGLPVEMRRREQIDTVVSPTESARVLSDRHELDTRDSKIGQFP